MEMIEEIKKVLEKMRTEEKIKEKIKKRVEWLLKEIEKLNEKLLYEAIDQNYYNGVFDTLKGVKDLIKKAFEGVI